MTRYGGDAHTLELLYFDSIIEYNWSSLRARGNDEHQGKTT